MLLTAISQANIITLLGIESLPEDEKKEIVMSMIELIEARVLERVLGSLDEKGREKLLEKMEEEDLENLLDLLVQNNIDLAALYDEEILKAKVELAKIAAEK